VLSASIPIAFSSAAATHIVQATLTNAKTKACPNVSFRILSGRVALPHPGLIDELGFVIQSEFLKTSILHRNK
jgi:hypothetical protein